MHERRDCNIGKMNVKRNPGQRLARRPGRARPWAVRNPPLAGKRRVRFKTPPAGGGRPGAVTIHLAGAEQGWLDPGAIARGGEDEVPGTAARRRREMIRRRVFPLPLAGCRKPPFSPWLLKKVQATHPSDGYPGASPIRWVPGTHPQDGHPSEWVPGARRTSSVRRSAARARRVPTGSGWPTGGGSPQMGLCQQPARRGHPPRNTRESGYTSPAGAVPPPLEPLRSRRRGVPPPPPGHT